MLLWPLPRNLQHRTLSFLLPKDLCHQLPPFPTSLTLVNLFLFVLCA